MIKYVVTLKLHGEVVMQSDHDYLPHAKSQANIWRRLYPHATITIGEVDENAHRYRRAL
jgi:hypothetical protein